MRSYSLIAPAKINLYLEIIGNAPGGYHELAMVLQSISLADRVNLRANGTQQFHCACDSNQVPQDKTNLAYRAAELMAKQFPQAFNRYGGVDINIEKQIPVSIFPVDKFFLFWNSFKSKWRMYYANQS